MLDYLISLCTTNEGLFSLIVGSDLLIALAYFSIPVAMLWVFRNRSEDLPYPALWIAFVLFIFACGATHLIHFAGALNNSALLEWRASIHVVTAIVSVATAIALSMALPKIALLPSPQRQQRELRIAVERATREKDALLLELNHRVGNHLAMLGAAVRKELRSSPREDPASLLRVQDLLEQLGEEHHRLSELDYDIHHPAHAFTTRLRQEGRMEAG
ncbi:hypothetical protein GRZ55_02170 [Chelativorans sp. ZYF759]|uniref:hypothetical protein n=1 Tax=Chelativorans sp. ZYF759 TaxID=2692213 RepID=UPI00145EC406|nr:hypothetical protein [Chelativorans sp. ZYF759]NMG38045.1 hypothetical protein [Chelativorans sp. ZYF759]